VRLKKFALCGVMLFAAGCTDRPKNSQAGWEELGSIAGSSAPLKDKVARLEKVGLKCSFAGQTATCTDGGTSHGVASTRTVRVSENGNYEIDISGAPSR